MFGITSKTKKAIIEQYTNDSASRESLTHNRFFLKRRLIIERGRNLIRRGLIRKGEVRKYEYIINEQTFQKMENGKYKRVIIILVK